MPNFFSQTGRIITTIWQAKQGLPPLLLALKIKDSKRPLDPDELLWH